MKRKQIDPFGPEWLAVLESTGQPSSMKDENGLWQIFSIPSEGGVPKQLTFYGPNDVCRNARVSDVSPDGKWILHTGDFIVDFASRL